MSWDVVLLPILNAYGIKECYMKHMANDETPMNLSHRDDIGRMSGYIKKTVGI
jgi:hypothetical protein